jgi:hypothetical protein
MGDRRGEPDHGAVLKDRMKQEHVLQMLTTGIRIVDREEIALLQRFDRIKLGTRLEDMPDGPKLHRDQFCLSNGIAERIQQRGGPVLGLPQHSGIGRSHQLRAHLPGRGDQRLADDRIIDRVERHAGILFISRLP